MQQDCEKGRGKTSGRALYLFVACARICSASLVTCRRVSRSRFIALDIARCATNTLCHRSLKCSVSGCCPDSCSYRSWSRGFCCATIVWPVEYRSCTAGGGGIRPAALPPLLLGAPASTIRLSLEERRAGRVPAQLPAASQNTLAIVCGRESKAPSRSSLAKAEKLSRSSSSIAIVRMRRGSMAARPASCPDASSKDDAVVSCSQYKQAHTHTNAAPRQLPLHKAHNKPPSLVALTFRYQADVAGRLPLKPVTNDAGSGQSFGELSSVSRCVLERASSGGTHAFGACCRSSVSRRRNAGVLLVNVCSGRACGLRVNSRIDCEPR